MSVARRLAIEICGRGPEQDRLDEMSRARLGVGPKGLLVMAGGSWHLEEMGVSGTWRAKDSSLPALIGLPRMARD